MYVELVVMGCLSVRDDEDKQRKLRLASDAVGSTVTGRQETWPVRLPGNMTDGGEGR